MGKKAAIQTTTIEEWEKSLAMASAKRMYISAAVNMGWQLAIAILIPVFIGVKLDEKFGTSSSYTLAALVLATGGAVMVVANTLKQVQKQQMTTKPRKRQT